MEARFENKSNAEDSAFEQFRNSKIDANKHTLFEVLYDPRLSQLEWDERMSIFEGWHDDMHRRELSYYRRQAINGCKVERDVFDPSTGRTTNMINFASNDYLNMSQHPAVINASIKAIQEYGTGVGAACNASGQTKLKYDLEKEIADTFENKAALVFNSGYSANIGILNALIRKNDIAIVDMLAHASVMDGVEHRNKMLFKHNDMQSLEMVLARANRQYTNKVVVVDGVYSMDGDIANLPEISALCKKYNTLLYVDEAHAFGVIGKNGLGILDHFNMPSNSIDILVGTLSKAIGSSGGFVTGSKRLIDYLGFACRSYMFSTGTFNASNAAALEAIRIIKSDNERRENLWKNINYFKLKVKNKYNIGNSETAIMPIILGDHNKVFEITRVMGNNGVQTNAMPYPVVSRKSSRIRMTITANMTIEQLNKGITELNNAIDAYEKGATTPPQVQEDNDATIAYQQKMSEERQALLSGNKTSVPKL